MLKHTHCVAFLLAALAVPVSFATLPVAVTDLDYYHDGQPPAARIELGRLLFFDKILSGNKNIACATCHHPSLASGDGVALPFGEGPRGLGRQRTPSDSAGEAVVGRVPRNSPPLFNLGAREFQKLFHDGRVEVDRNGYYASGFISPARWKLPPGLDNVLAAQAMFPILSAAEMAGNKGENPVANAVAGNNAAGPNGAWRLLARRLQAINGYVDLFQRAFPQHVSSAEDISMVLTANAIAAFEARAFRSDDSPFDRYLRSRSNSLPKPAARGMALFYGAAGCSACHSGPFQTDHDFHAIAMPQIGPGKADGSDASYWRETGHQATLEDFGRGRVSARTEDRYAFRTPSLRNVALTGPWGHSGAYDSLEDVVRHHLDPVAALHGYGEARRILAPLESVVELTARGSALSQSPLGGARLKGFLRRDSWVQDNPVLRQRIAQANELAPTRLTDRQVDNLLAFLNTLTDPAAKALDEWVPEQVPSGLPVSD